MRTSVTAIVVINTGEWLDTTLAALRAQIVKPDRIVGVINSAAATVSEKLADAGVSQVIDLGKQLPYGKAIDAAERVTPLADDTPQAHPETMGESTEWLWLLTEDSAPEPRALQELLESVVRAPSVAVAGPKLIDWDRPERIIELGQSLTKTGNRWLLRRQELDQEQYDHLQDTLGVGPTGMLVKREVWRELSGFDPALPVYDDGLDFSIRARLAGHRVVVAPRSRIRVAMSGIAGPQYDRRGKTARRNHVAARISHLHRKLSYTAAPLAALLWLGLPILGILRVFWALLREQPGNIWGEISSAFYVFFTPGKALAARRNIKANNIAGWGAIDPLRTDSRTVYTAKMIDREALLRAQGRKRKELHFISTGGFTVLLISIVIAISLTWWLYGRQSLSGGGSAPLSSWDILWANTRIKEGVPADPFTWVIGALGSLTFWKPGLALVIFLAASIPLATLGGWIWGAQFTGSPAGRALAGLGWALSPVVLGSIDHAHIQTVLLAVTLPWLLIAATRAHESWAWAGTASLLAAVALATAPVLIPVALLMWLLGMLLHPRKIAQIFATALAPAALFAPIFVHAIITRTPLAVLRDPGVTTPYEPASLPHLLIGFPAQGLEGWGIFLDRLGITGVPATLVVGTMVASLAFLAVLGVFAGKVPVTVFSALLGGAGMVTAIFSAGTSLTTSGPESVNLWTGSGLALYWLALITLASSGLTLLHKTAPAIAAIALVTNLVAVSPLLVSLATGQSQARESATPVPSIVQAAGAQNPNLQTLRITAVAPDAIRAEIINGSGLRLDQIRTAKFSVANERNRKIAQVTGALASPGAADLAAQLTESGISYVLLSNSGDPSSRARLQATLDEHGALAAAGTTGAGSLWRVSSERPEQVDAAADAIAEAETASFTRTLFNLAKLPLTAKTVWTIQAVVLLAMLLLALPTGEVTEQAPRRRRNKKNRPVTDTTASGLLRRNSAKKQAQRANAITASAPTTTSAAAVTQTDLGAPL